MKVKATVLVTAPAQRVISLASLKNFLRIDTTDDEAMLQIQLKTAEKRLESELGIKFVTQTWDVFFDSFPFSRRSEKWWDGTREGAITELYNYGEGQIELPFGPAQSVTGVYYYEEDNTENTVAASNYTLDTASTRARIGLKTGQTWPSTILKPNNGVKVRAVFGYGAGYIESPATESTISADIQEAVKHFAAYLYEHRGDELPKIPPTVLTLLEPYVRHRL